MEYHLFLYLPDCVDYLKNWDLTVDDVKTAFNIGMPLILTFQVITCTTELFRRGYRVFIHAAPDDEYEITLGKNERTSREIRMWHCLYKMILAGEFDRKEMQNNAEQ